MKNNSKFHVLLAEDDYLVSETIKGILDKIGYIVVGRATDGLEAIEMTQSTQPDVVLMDIEMPEMGGLEATRRIQDRCPTPVVILTAYETEDLVTEASEAGAGAYLVKPPDPSQLKRAITIAVARFGDMMALRESNCRLKETLIELKAAQQRIIKQERLAAVGQLAAGIAHDYNNIMASIILNADILLQSARLSPTEREQLTTILEQGHRAASLTQQILDFSRRAMLRRQDIDLVDFLKKTITQLEHELPTNINVHLHYDAPSIIVNADPRRLQQAIANLAANARDVMPKGGNLDLTLDLLQLRKGDPPPCQGLKPGTWARLTVTDNGSGIPPDVLPHIFEPFFTTGAPPHSGLGLPQTYGIVKQHGGQIDVQSEVGEGTTVTIYLPALFASVPEAPAAGEITIPEGKAETILIIEESPVIRKALADSLESLNYRVMTTLPGQEALSLLKEHRDDVALILIDVTTSRLEELTMCRTVSKHIPDIPIILLSDYSYEGQDRSWSSVGFVGWLKKPVMLEKLAQMVAQALA